MPRDGEARERGLLNWLDLLAEARERPLAEGAQHSGVDPLHAAGTRAELPFEHRARGRELAERARYESRPDAEPAREVDRGERTVGPREAPRDRDERTEVAREERIRQSGGHDDAERV